MRYLKVLFLACLIFIALVFFFQNQAIFSTRMDLFFIPPMTSISLPFYFLVICSFFIGVILALILLVWDRLSLSARIMKDKWQIQNLSSKLAKVEKLVQNQESRTFWGRVRTFFSTDTAQPLTDAQIAQISKVSQSVVAQSNKDQQTAPVAQPTQAPADAKRILTQPSANQPA